MWLCMHSIQYRFKVTRRSASSSWFILWWSRVPVLLWVQLASVGYKHCVEKAYAHLANGALVYGCFHVYFLSCIYFRVSISSSCTLSSFSSSNIMNETHISKNIWKMQVFFSNRFPCMVLLHPVRRHLRACLVLDAVAASRLPYTKGAHVYAIVLYWPSEHCSVIVQIESR